METEKDETTEETQTITINGDTCEVRAVHTGGYLTVLDLDDGTEWYIAENSETAGEAARKSYDGTEQDVDGCSTALEEELGFKPTVAYRHN